MTTKRGECRWCGHPKSLHLGTYRRLLRKQYPHISWTVTCCDECVKGVRLCSRYEP